MQGWHLLGWISLRVGYEPHQRGYGLPFNWIQGTASHQGWLRTLQRSPLVAFTITIKSPCCVPRNPVHGVPELLLLLGTCCWFQDEPYERTFSGFGNFFLNSPGSATYNR